MNSSGISTEIMDVADEMMQLIKDGEIHKHVMSNSAIQRYGDLEHTEMMEYGEFIKTKFCFDLMGLRGQCNHE